MRASAGRGLRRGVAERDPAQRASEADLGRVELADRVQRGRVGRPTGPSQGPGAAHGRNAVMPESIGAGT